MFLFSATAAFVLWQNAHLTVLWDLSYILENASRIALGQLPYRDFPFPYAPLTFLIQAAIIKLAGRAVWHHYLYAACAAGAASLLTWRILLRLLSASRLPARLLASLLAAPMIFLGTSSIFPHPFYDADCTLLILFCLWTLLKLEEKGFPPRLTFLCGALLVLPPLAKQNTGLAFLLSAVVCLAWLAFCNRHLAGQGTGAPYLPSFGRCGILLVGTIVGCALAVAALHFTVGLHNYLLWTVHFAASRRLPALSNIVEIYRDPALLAGYVTFAAGAALLLLLPASRRKLRWLAAALLCYPSAGALSGLFRYEDPADRVEPLLHLWPVLLLAATVAALIQLWRARSVAQILPAILLGSIHGAFLSQQLWGSTYALWPLLAILIAAILAALAEAQPRTNPTRPLIAFALFASVVLGITGGYYALSHERLSYVDLDGELHHSRLPSLRGLAIAGDWLPDFEELADYAAREIPRDDAILAIPGEDLFYFTTGRTPRFPVVMMDHTVNPYSAAELASLARRRNVRWVIVKRRLQLQEEPIPFRAQLLEELSRDFVPAAELDNYDIYRRR
jgi:hypothetical protein